MIAHIKNPAIVRTVEKMPFYVIGLDTRLIAGPVDELQAISCAQTINEVRGCVACFTCRCPPMGNHDQTTGQVTKPKRKRRRSSGAA